MFLVDLFVFVPLYTIENSRQSRRFETDQFTRDEIKMKVYIFIHAIFSIAYALNGTIDIDDETNIERRSSGLYNVMLKPYVLELLNSKYVAQLKRTPCWYNLHFLTTNPDLHYLAKLPIARALFTSRLPGFQNWLLNLTKGPSATKGNDSLIITFIIKMLSVTSFRRIDIMMNHKRDNEENVQNTCSETDVGCSRAFQIGSLPLLENSLGSILTSIVKIA